MFDRRGDAKSLYFEWLLGNLMLSEFGAKEASKKDLVVAIDVQCGTNTVLGHRSVCDKVLKQCICLLCLRAGLLASISPLEWGKGLGAVGENSAESFKRANEGSKTANGFWRGTGR